MTDSDFVAGVVWFSLMGVLVFVAAVLVGICGHALWIVLRYGWGVL